MTKLTEFLDQMAAEYPGAKDALLEASLVIAWQSGAIEQLEAENARLRNLFDDAPAIDWRQKDSPPYLREYARRIEDWQREGMRMPGALADRAEAS